MAIGRNESLFLLTCPPESQLGLSTGKEQKKKSTQGRVARKIRNQRHIGYIRLTIQARV